MKKKKKIIIILAVIILFIVIFIVYIVYFFFGTKKYTFYMTHNTMEIEAVQIYIDGNINQELMDSIVIYKQEVINDILEELEKVKLKPNFSFLAMEGSKKGFSFIFLGKDNKRFNYVAGEGEDNYFVDMSMEKNGVIDNDGIEYLINFTSIDKEQGEKLYDLANQVLEDNICEITASNIEKMSREKIHDWNQFQQYVFIDEETRSITKDELTANGTARFQIAEKKGYLEVCYFNGIIADSKGTNRYAKVLEAVVYNEKGEKLDLYAEEISAFLEEME